MPPVAGSRQAAQLLYCFQKQPEEGLGRRRAPLGSISPRSSDSQQTWAPIPDARQSGAQTAAPGAFAAPVQRRLCRHEVRSWKGRDVCPASSGAWRPRGAAGPPPSRPPRALPLPPSPRGSPPETPGEPGAGPLERQADDGLSLAPPRPPRSLSLRRTPRAPPRPLAAPGSPQAPQPGSGAAPLQQTPGPPRPPARSLRCLRGPPAWLLGSLRRARPPARVTSQPQSCPVPPRGASQAAGARRQGQPEPSPRGCLGWGGLGWGGLTSCCGRCVRRGGGGRRGP